MQQVTLIPVCVSLFLPFSPSKHHRSDLLTPIRDKPINTANEKHSSRHYRLLNYINFLPTPMYGSFLFFFYRTLLTPSFSQCVWCCEKNCIMNVSLYREEWSLQEDMYSLKRRKNETSSEDYIAAGRISIRCKQHSKFHLPLSSLAPFDLFLCVFCLRLHESVTKPFAPQKSDHPTNLFKYLSTPYLMIFTHSSWPSNLFEFITKFVCGWFL